MLGVIFHLKKLAPTLGALVLLLALQAQAGAQTVLEGDHTWTVANSPYVIGEDTTIAEGSSLTIEHNVTVTFSAGRSLTVKGRLIARGRAAAPIIFTGAISGAERVRWGSVIFKDTSAPARFQNLDDYLDGSIVEHVTFEYATRALVLLGAAPYIHRCTFQHNFYKFNGDSRGGAAIQMMEMSSPRVRECLFQDNESKSPAEGGAIYVMEGHPIFQDNTFTENASGYGGAMAVYNILSPLVGNTFEYNLAAWEGGGVAMVSSAPALLNNTVRYNQTFTDGAGVHVCVDCYPHANPLMMDNTIADNKSDIMGGAGIGAAFMRVFSHNNVYGNVTAGNPHDFEWFNKIEDGYPDWVQRPDISRNWWGTTDRAAIAASIHDGLDDPAVATVIVEPILTAPVTKPETRVTITNRKIRYKDDGEPMPVYLTIYNPGPERAVRLRIMLQYGESPPVFLQKGVDFPGATPGEDGYLMTLPANSVYFSKLMEPAQAVVQGFTSGAWHATLFERGTGKRIGNVITARFIIGTGGV